MKPFCEPSVCGFLPPLWGKVRMGGVTVVLLSSAPPPCPSPARGEGTHSRKVNEDAGINENRSRHFILLIAPHHRPPRSLWKRGKTFVRGKNIGFHIIVDHCLASQLLHRSDQHHPIEH